MSETFKDILYNSHPESLINTIHIIAFVVCILVPIITKKFWLSLLINSVLLIIAFLVVDAIFYDWWESLKTNIQNDSDRTWIADHDGGIIIVGVKMLMKTAGTWIIALVLGFFMAKQKEIRIVEQNSSPNMYQP